jgi:hypothetical protein
MGANEIGIVYVASRKPAFLCEATLAAESVKNLMTGMSITLFTDMPCRIGTTGQPFDQIVFADSWCLRVHNNTMASRGQGLLTKITGLARSPYRKTLFLDTDTRVLSSDVEQVFEFLDENSLAMVPCTPGNSQTCKLFGPMFNTGVMAYRKDGHTERLFREWEALQRYHLSLMNTDPPGDVAHLSRFDYTSRKMLLMANQTSLAMLLSPCVNPHHIPVKSLPDSWNARNYARDSLDGVIVDHASCHKISDQATMSDVAASRRIQLMALKAM